MVVNLITPLTKKMNLYSDLYKDLTINPISEDLALKLDEEAVKESIKNLILTDKGERLFQPNLGGNIRAMLFENNTPATVKIVQDQIETIIKQYEPRAELIDVQVTSNIDDYNMNVKIIFYVSNNQAPITVSVFLERTR